MVYPTLLAAIGDKRQESRLRRGEVPFQNDRGFHLRLSGRGKPQRLAAGANCDRQRLRAAGDQDEQAVSRGFLQCFEEGVGCADRQPVGVVDQTDFAFSHERPVDELLFNLAHLFDLDYNKAISAFSQPQTMLQAAQKSFKSMMDMTLFNYM